jgi:hypothetical protein
MNIFYLDRDPVIAAQMQCDKHVIKMILESAQMLSTAHRVLDGDDYANDAGMYKLTHKNHPSAIWVRSCFENYVWLYKHMVALMEEYTFRYGKHHATERLLFPLSGCPVTIPHRPCMKSYIMFQGKTWIPMVGFTDPPMCMPEECKGDDTVLAYQNYYIAEKSSFATYKNRSVPAFMKGEMSHQL